MRRKRKNCPTPVKANEYVNTHFGWLLPDGKLYPCGYGDHERLAYKLGFDHGGELERVGKAIRLCNDYKRTHKVSYFFSKERLKWDDLTQAQCDTIFDFAVALDVELFRVAGTLDCPKPSQN